MQTSRSFIGMDVHKATISISVAEYGRNGPVRFLGVIPNTAEDVAKMAKRLARHGELEFCYDAADALTGFFGERYELRTDLDGLANRVLQLIRQEQMPDRCDERLFDSCRELLVAELTTHADERHMARSLPGRPCRSFSCSHSLS
jgi:hypothetical protein